MRRRKDFSICVDLKILIRPLVVGAYFFSAIWATPHYATANSGDTINQAANAAMSVGTVMMVTNSAQASKNASPCSSGSMGNCIVMGAALLQVVASFRNRDRAGRTEGASRCVGEYCGQIGDNGNNGDNGTDGGPNFQNPPNGGPGNVPGQTLRPLTTSNTLNNLITNAELGLNRLRSDGYEFDERGNITTPDGKKLSLSSLGTDQGLKSAGFSDSEIESINNAKKLSAKDQEKVNKLLAQIASELGGEGGGARKKGGGSTQEGFDYSKLFAGLNKNDGLGANRDLAGLQKRLGSDSIGIAQDNIFLMVQRRYQVKQTTLTP